jgi:fibrillarin-like pre-rRNA processing protein
MSPPHAFQPDPRQRTISAQALTFPFPGLSVARSPPEDRPTFWTRALGDPPEVYGERVRRSEETVWRAIDPFRSKLGAALCRGLRHLPISPGATVVYLGGASGTTASHVADLIGRKGSVYAVEKSPRPFQKLVEVARRWPNLFPVLGDALVPGSYLPLVPPAQALYLDIAQPEQVDIALTHARLFLSSGGGLVLCLKVPSLRSRGRDPEELVHQSTRALATAFELDRPVGLEPFHRGHVMITGTYRGRG